MRLYSAGISAYQAGVPADDFGLNTTTRIRWRDWTGD
ncbi:hypothetical protein AGR9A_Cc80223 [Agrobacterium salinitolerans str. Hayward 0363]|nr:hypothetical protein AGR9A_Cc80223 [Agrobacterium salinitolerans str. Hayward 0363]